jgi:hypothetical protein
VVKEIPKYVADGDILIPNLLHIIRICDGMMDVVGQNILL